MGRPTGKPSSQLAQAGGATIQQWITATERIVMGTRQLLDLLAERLQIVDNRYSTRCQEMEERLDVLERLAFPSPENDLKTSSTDDSETLETTG